MKVLLLLRKFIRRLRAFDDVDCWQVVEKTKVRKISLVGAVRAWECRCSAAQLSLPPQGCFGGTQGCAQPRLCVTQCWAHIMMPDKPTNFLLIFHFYKPRLYHNQETSLATLCC